MSNHESAFSRRAPRDYFHSASPQPHPGRAREILRRHPEVRDLIGRNPATFWITLGIVACQVALAAALSSSPWWLLVGVAATAGAFANHALWVIIHEATHNLIFRTAGANTVAGIIAGLPHGTPTSVFFQRYHMKHHAFLGSYDYDADVPSRWEARLFGSSPFGKALWMLFFSVIEALRPTRLRVVKPIDRWVILNVAAQLLFDAAVWIFFGPQALVYLLVSLFFSVGLHPLGARWIQEHFILFPGQETTSYYGVMNPIAMNIGYHNEHHDFPSVPWNRLPQLRRSAPEAYDTLYSIRSWSRLLWRFIVDPELSQFSRHVRADVRGGRPVEAAAEDPEPAAANGPDRSPSATPV